MSAAIRPEPGAGRDLLRGEQLPDDFVHQLEQLGLVPRPWRARSRPRCRPADRASGGLELPAGLDQGAEQVVSRVEVLAAAARPPGGPAASAGARSAAGEEVQQRSRIDRADGAGAVQLGGEQIHHPFAQVGESPSPRTAKGSTAMVPAESASPAAGAGRGYSPPVRASPAPAPAPGPRAMRRAKSSYAWIAAGRSPARSSSASRRRSAASSSGDSSSARRAHGRRSRRGPRARIAP